MKNMKHAALVGAMAAALTACGGGDGGDDTGPADAIAGFYTGSLSMTEVPVVVAEEVATVAVAVEATEVVETPTPDHEGDALTLVLDSGEYFVLSNAVNGWNLGLQGNVTLAAGSTLQSTNSKGFFENGGVNALTVSSASYVARSSVTAELADSYYSYSLSLSGFSNAVPARTSLSAIPNWYGGGKRTHDDARSEWGSFTIDSNGVLSGGTYETSTESCTYSGRVNPVKGGFTLSITFGTGCHWAGQTLNGWLVQDPDHAEDSLLRGILLKTDRSEGEIIAFGDGRRA